MPEPDELLARIRLAVLRLADADDYAAGGQEDWDELHSAVVSLDHHLSKGGKLPTAWAYARPAPL